VKAGPREVGAASSPLPTVPQEPVPLARVGRGRPETDQQLTDFHRLYWIVRARGRSAGRRSTPPRSDGKPSFGCYIAAMPSPRIASGFVVAAAVFSAIFLPGAAQAESALRLKRPADFGRVPAATYDIDRNRVGDAEILIEEIADGRIRMTIESGIDEGARTVAMAELEPVDGGESMRLTKQVSRSYDPDGVDLGILTIDHENGIASCEKGAGGDMKTQLLKLPEQDRVANVPLNLLFQPLIEGKRESMEFQALICRFGARLVDIEAKVAPRSDDAAEDDPFVEIESSPNFGKFITFMAGDLMPRLSFWFDPREANPWVAHRVPLYSKGPEVYVIRDTGAAAWLASHD
jgi:hypothetical protein